MRHKKIIGLLIVFLLVASIVAIPAISVIPVAKAGVPESPTLISPLNYAVLATNSETFPIYLQWNAVANASTYTVQVSTVDDFSSLVFSATGTTNHWLTPSLELGTVYYWHVKATNGDGDSAWSSTWQFKIIPKTPVLLSPSNCNYCLRPGYINLEWYSYSFSRTEIQISHYSNFSSLLFSVVIGQAPYVYSNGRYCYHWSVYLTDLNVYYWRARTISSNGTASFWTPARSFRLNIPPTASPYLVVPSNESLINQTSVFLDWNSVYNATSYQIQIKDRRGLVMSASTTRTDCNFSGYNNHCYWWRVRAVNCVGYGPWSSWIGFCILLPPSTPQVVSPAANQIFITNYIKIVWQPVNTADYYEVRISNLNKGVVKRFRISSNSLIFTGEYNCRYLLQIRAVNRAGVSSWTSRYFEIIDKNPPIITINYPDKTNQSRITIQGTITDIGSGVNAAWLNGQQLSLASDGKFAINVNLSSGNNKFIVEAMDNAGNQSERKIVTVFCDREAPEIEILNPQTSLYEKYIKVVTDVKLVGKVTDNDRIRELRINNDIVQFDSDGVFVYQTKLKYGANTIHLLVMDEAGNVSKKKLLISKVQANKKIVFQIGSPNMSISEIDPETGKIESVIKEIDPGRGTVPVIYQNRTFIPIRAFVETIGGKVYWNNGERKVTIKLPSRSVVIELWIGKNRAKINGQWMPIDDNSNVKPFIRNGRSFFPLRFILESFDLPWDSIQWNAVLQSVTILWPVYPSP